MVENNGKHWAESAALYLGGRKLSPSNRKNSKKLKLMIIC